MDPSILLLKIKRVLTNPRVLLLKIKESRVWHMMKIKGVLTKSRVWHIWHMMKTKGVPAIIPVPPAELKWETDGILQINDIRFIVTYDADGLHSLNSSENCFVLGKDRTMIEKYFAISQAAEIRKVFEMGIFKGGSVVFYDQIFQLEKIAAIEFLGEPIQALEEYIVSREKYDVVKPYYGINQADRWTMGNILSSEFPGKDIDLVIDDASHLYFETREAFNITFPYLRVGGLYIIEDWAWAHWDGIWQEPQKSFFSFKKPALSNLLIELFMLAARCSLIENIWVNHNFIMVKKGSGEFPQGNFDIADHYLLRDRRFESWL